ncbi:efflux transporter outer membrane subunit [Chitinimonas naiadis]
MGDPALANVVETALANNLDIAIAATRVEEARAQFRLVDAQRQPELIGVIQPARQRSVNAFGKGVTQTNGVAQLSLSYDLDLFGRLSSASEVARASLLATEAARDTVRLAVASAAAAGYVSLRSLDARLALLRDTVRARAESLRIAQRRADTGYAPMLEMQQAEAEYRAAEQLIPGTELAIRRQEDALSLLLGETPRAIVRGRPLDTLSVLTVPVSLPSELLRRRPDIAQAEQQLVAADHSLDAARAAFMPRIQLGISGGIVDANILPEPVRIFSVGGSILAPIFEAGRLQAQADAAAMRRDQAAYGYRKATLTAFKEVEDALASVQYSDAQERALDSQRDALARTLAYATKRYKAGYSPYLEQIDAQRFLLSADLALVQSRADRLLAMISLYQSIGGGWQFSAANQP